VQKYIKESFYNIQAKANDVKTLIYYIEVAK